MPTYEYRCPAGHDFEKFYRKISEAEARVFCPECGEVAARQLSAGGGLLFKGSGFYITDYGKDGKKAQTSLGEPKGKVEESKAGEAKPAGDTTSEVAAKPAAESAKPADGKPTGAPKGPKKSE